MLAAVLQRVYWACKQGGTPAGLSHVPCAEICGFKRVKGRNLLVSCGPHAGIEGLRPSHHGMRARPGVNATTLQSLSPHSPDK